MELRISTTQIDQFNKMLITDYVSEENIIKSIKGEFEQSKKMALGSAFHSVLESPHTCFDEYCNKFGGTGFLSPEGIVFPFDVITSAYEYVDYKYPFFEIKNTKDYDVLGHKVKVVAKVDQLVGNYVMEHKSTWSGFKYSNYSQSLQKDFYLDIFEADRVIYKVFELYDGADGIKLKGVYPFYFDRDIGLEARINSALINIISYIEEKGLFEYLKPEEETDVFDRVFCK